MGFAPVADYAAGEADWIAAGLPIEGEAASEPMVTEVLRDVPQVSLDEPAAKAYSLIRDSGWSTAMVVDEDSVVLGRLYAGDLSEGASGAVAEHMQEGPSTVRASLSIHEASHMMEDNDLITLPVTTPEGVLLGMLRREDVQNG